MRDRRGEAAVTIIGKGQVFLNQRKRAELDRRFGIVRGDRAGKRGSGQDAAERMVERCRRDDRQGPAGPLQRIGKPMPA